MLRGKDKMKFWLFVIGVISMFSIFISMFLFLTPQGINILHENTDIICNSFYDEENEGWKLQANTTLNYQFIKECEEREIGRKVNSNEK